MVRENQHEIAGYEVTAPQMEQFVPHRQGAVTQRMLADQNAQINAENTSGQVPAWEHVYMLSVVRHPDALVQLLFPEHFAKACLISFWSITE